MLGNRDLNQSDLPQQSWEGRHIAYTHGYADGAVAGERARTSPGSRTSC